MLTIARYQMERLTLWFRRNALGASAFLLGGAVLSTILRTLQGAVPSATTNLGTKVVATIVVGLLTLAIAFVIVRGAAVAPPYSANDGQADACTVANDWSLWGSATRPARILARVGIVLALLPWLLIPLGILFSWISENVGSIGP